MLIHYFDSESLPDIRWTFPIYKQSDGVDFKPNQTDGADQPELLDDLALGQPVVFEVHAYYLYGMPKTNGDETYYGIVRNVRRKQVGEVLRSFYDPSIDGKEG